MVRRRQRRDDGEGRRVSVGQPLPSEVMGTNAVIDLIDVRRGTSGVTARFPPATGLR